MSHDWIDYFIIKVLMENLFRYFITIYDTSLHETLFSIDNEIEYNIIYINNDAWT